MIDDILPLYDDTGNDTWHLPMMIDDDVTCDLTHDPRSDDAMDRSVSL